MKKSLLIVISLLMAFLIVMTSCGGGFEPDITESDSDGITMQTGIEKETEKETTILMVLKNLTITTLRRRTDSLVHQRFQVV